MATIMTEERASSVLSLKSSVDNGVMIGWLGYQMVKGNYKITEEDNKVHKNTEQIWLR